MKNILIGGADGYLGNQALKFFSAKGYSITGVCFSADSLKKTNGWIQEQKLDSIKLYQADLSNEAQVINLFKQLAMDNFAVANIFNAAGGFIFVKPQDAKSTDVDFLLNANFKSNWLLVKYGLPAMQKNNSGRIVLVSAAATQTSPISGMGLYVASKLALNALVTSTADEVKNSNIKINSVAPTIIDTPRNRQDMPDADFSKWVSADKILTHVLKLMDESPSASNGAMVTIGG